MSEHSDELRQLLDPQSDLKDQMEDLEAKALYLFYHLHYHLTTYRLAQGFDPMKDHKEIAKSLGLGDDYIQQVDDSGLTIPEEVYRKREEEQRKRKQNDQKLPLNAKIEGDKPYLKGGKAVRSLESSTEFSMVNPDVSDVNIEKYKASIHEPSLTNIPDDADRREYLKQFSDEDIEKFMQNTENDQFDHELLEAAHSRHQQVKRRKGYRDSGFQPSHEHSDDETDVMVRMTKQQDEFERATKLQRNILDMELTKEQDEEFKKLVERENTDGLVDPSKH